MFNLFEGDGVIENIYHLLWTKDTIFGTEPNVVIPHTVLYKYQKPCYWYFTSKQDNKLKKKSSMKLTKEHIKEVFTKKISQSGIVAYYIYKKFGLGSKYEVDKKKNVENMVEFKTKVSMEFEKSTNKEASFVIEYFDKKKFEDFLNNNVVYDDGILQKFEDPKGEFNSTIRLIWSPKLCIFERSSNLKKIYDTRFDIYERAVTYDGEEFQTKTEPIKGNNIPDRVEKIGWNIASHIANITLERIKVIRMVLNFKITKDDKIIFLWCSSLRIDNSFDKKRERSIKEFDIKKIKIQVPDNINIFKLSSYGKPIKPLKDSNCLNCDFLVESYKLYEIGFKTLIQSHENRKRDKDYFKIFGNVNMTSSGVEIIPFIENKTLDPVVEKTKKKQYRNLLIPKVIQSLYPKLKYEDYQILRKDPIFKSKSAYVCEACFLDITRYCNFSGSNTEYLIKNMRPEVNEEIANKYKKINNSNITKDSAILIKEDYNYNPNVQTKYFPNIKNNSNVNQMRSHTSQINQRGQIKMTNEFRNNIQISRFDKTNFNFENSHNNKFNNHEHPILRDERNLKNNIPLPKLSNKQIELNKKFDNIIKDKIINRHPLPMENLNNVTEMTSLEAESITNNNSTIKKK